MLNVLLLDICVGYGILPKLLAIEIIGWESGSVGELCNFKNGECDGSDKGRNLIVDCSVFLENLKF
jgi:hypothetical protein